jgi:hypothetical protein
MTSRIDELLWSTATVHDHELGDSASCAGAGALLDAIVAEAPVPAVGVRPRAWRRRLLLHGAVATAAATAVLIGTGAFWPHSDQSYANSAMTIKREGGFYAATVKDAYADPNRFAEVFRKVGLDVQLNIVPVSESYEREVVRLGFQETGGGPQPRMIYVDPQCPPGHGNACPMTLRIDAHAKGTRTQVWLGRRARPGETYFQGAPADREGEPLAGIDLKGKTVTEALTVLRAHKLTATYKIKYTLSGSYTLREPGSRKIDTRRRVVETEMHSSSMVTLIVTSRKGDPRPF